MARYGCSGLVFVDLEIWRVRRAVEGLGGRLDIFRVWRCLLSRFILRQGIAGWGWWRKAASVSSWPGYVWSGAPRDTKLAMHLPSVESARSEASS